MREDALSERPPLAQQAEAEPDDANCAIPVAQKASAPLHAADPRSAVVPLKFTPNDNPHDRQRMGSKKLTISQSLHPNIARGNFRTNMFASLLPSTAVAQQVIAGLCFAAFVLAWLAYRRLRDQNRRVSTALNNMSQGLNMFDAQGRIILLNTRY